jgi:hypothetical protein
VNSWNMPLCPECLVSFGNRELFAQHVEIYHGTSFDARIIPFVIRHNHFKGNYKVFEQKFSEDDKITLKTFEEISEALKIELPRVLKTLAYPNLINVVIELTMTKNDAERGIDNFVDFTLQGKNLRVFNKDSIETDVKTILQDLGDKFDKRTNLGSGLTLFGFNSVLVSSLLKINKHFFGCENDYEEELPEWVRKEILPTKKVGKDKCFIASVNASVHRQKSFESIPFNYSGYKKIPTTFPVEMDTMLKFAKANDMNFHLYGFTEVDPDFVKNAKKIVNIETDGIVYPMYNSPPEAKGPKVYLLLYKDHLFPIRNPGRLLRPKLNSKPYMQCLRCGTTNQNKTKLEIHYKNCLNMDRSFTRIFKTDKFFKGNSFLDTELRSYICSLDTEAVLNPITHKRHGNRHTLLSYALTLVKGGFNPEFAKHDHQCDGARMRRRRRRSTMW